MSLDDAIADLISMKNYYNDKNEDSYVGFDEEDNEAIDMAIKALEQQPCEEENPNCTECIYYDHEKHHCPRFCKVIENTMAEITSEQTKWIPVNEKPQEGRYLCTYEHYDGKCIDFGSFDGEAWYIKPIAYMPLPQPYAESEG